MSKQNDKQGCGCGCANIPISVILLFIGGGYWYLQKHGLPDVDLARVNRLLAKVPGIEIRIPVDEPPPPPVPPTPTPSLPATSIVSDPKLPPTEILPEADEAQPEAKQQPQVLPKTDWKKKNIRGIYLSRYQVTNNASEQMIR